LKDLAASPRSTGRLRLEALHGFAARELDLTLEGFGGFAVMDFAASPRRNWS
jgi:hypothetical protein